MNNEIREAIKHQEGIVVQLAKTNQYPISLKFAKTALAALKFVGHIQDHLTKDQQVICKICGKSFHDFNKE